MSPPSYPIYSIDENGNSSLAEALLTRLMQHESLMEKLLERLESDDIVE